MKFFGIDEAALGPRLGPFCAGLVEVDAAEAFDGKQTDLYEILDTAVSKETTGREDSSRLVIADSKKIYNPTRGIGDLEAAVYTVITALGHDLPRSLEDLLRRFCPSEDYEALSDIPWFENAGESALPLAEAPSEGFQHRADRFTGVLRDKSLELRPPKLRMVCARDFNHKIRKNGGKSGAIRSILQPLMERALENWRSGIGRVSVDRQGGRRFYGDWLIELLPGAPLRIIEEKSDQSVYEVKAYRIEFLVSGDALRLEIALASMLAKYLREAAMHYFNTWWTDRVAGLRPTAGYPQDARRFLRDLETAGLMPGNPENLVRLS